MKKKKQPLFTASCGLMFFTFLVLIGVCFAYFFWYEKSAMKFFYTKPKPHTIVVEPKDNLRVILENVKNSTVIQLKQGKYVGNFQLKNRENIEIVGVEGAFLTAVRGSTLLLQDCTKCKIRNLVLHTEDKQQPAFSIIKSTDLQVQKLRIQGSTVIQAGSDRLNFSEIGTTEQIKIVQTNVALITKCNFQTQKNIALLVEQSTEISIANNIIQGVQFSKVTGEKNNMIVNNHISGTTKGIFGKESQNIYCLNNNITTDNGDAIFLLNCRNCTIGEKQDENRENNKIKAKNGYACAISGCNTITIQQNALLNQDPEKKCLYILASRNIQIDNNSIIGTPLYDEQGEMKELSGGGVQIASSRDITFSENDIANSMLGVRIEKETKGMFKNNKVYQNIGNGFEIENSEITLQENVIRQNINGVQWKNSQGSMTQNIIQENKNDGVIFEKSTAEIRENNINHNMNNGISLNKNSLPIIENNKIHKNQGFGIAFFQPNKMEYKKNDFLENVKGAISN
ncbi:MAG TPA: right-handed parallel beta-helix repeat-containing protein [Planctomycetota bacterium]|nr:right-handed parallel beta-helix repeat-containing protein [Planctomycetota bacterium]